MNKQRIDNQAMEKEKHYEVLIALTEIYNTMHVIDLVQDVFYEYKSKDYVDTYLNHYTEHASQGMVAVMTARSNKSLLPAVLKFSDLTTLGERMKDKNFIFMDFIGLEKQWMRATFVVIERDSKGYATKVIFTTQNIHESKMYEEDLLKKSNTDQLTGVYNRRAYENDKYKIEQQDEMNDVALFMFDVNGLKHANDTYGHQTGDELLLVSSNCMKQVFSPYGNIYRIGGDEFVGIIYLKESSAEELIKQFKDEVKRHATDYAEGLSISVGYALGQETAKNFAKLEELADQRMYKEKAVYYQEINN